MAGPGGSSLVDRIMAVGGTEESSVLGALFPKDLKKKKQLTEVSPDLVFPMACLGLVQRRWKSSVLKQFTDEFCDWEMSKDRKGRIEAVELSGALRRSSMDED